MVQILVVRNHLEKHESASYAKAIILNKAKYYLGFGPKFRKY
jgi:hypothetical protein